MLKLGYNSNGFVHHRLDDALVWLSDLGYQSVALTPDVGRLDPRETASDHLRRLGARCAELGLTPVVETGARYLFDARRKHRPNLLEVDDSHQVRLQFLRKMIEWANLLGAPVLSFWSGALPEGQTDEGAHDRMQKAMEVLHSLAERRGIALGLEPEPGHWIGDLDDYRKFSEASPGLVSLTLDVGHLLVTEESTPHKAVKVWKNEIVNLQLDDMEYGEHVHLAPGEGELDWKKLAKALHELDLDVPACFELSRDSHRFHELAPAAIAFWRGLEAKASKPDRTRQKKPSSS